MVEKRDVLVQAPAATRVRIKTAAVALHPSGLRHLDIIGTWISSALGLHHHAKR
jgi:hypothetical protein